MAAAGWILSIPRRYRFSLTRGAACGLCAFVVFLSLGPAGSAPHPQAQPPLEQGSTIVPPETPISDRMCIMKWRAAYAGHYERLERQRSEYLLRETETAEQPAEHVKSGTAGAVRLVSSTSRRERAPAVQAQEAADFWRRVRTESERMLGGQLEPPRDGEPPVLSGAEHASVRPANPPTWSILLALGLSLPIGVVAAAMRRAHAAGALHRGVDPVMQLQLPSLFFDSPRGSRALRPVAGWTDAFVVAAAVVLLAVAANCLLVPGGWTQAASNPLSAVAALWGG